MALRSVTYSGNIAKNETVTVSHTIYFRLTETKSIMERNSLIQISSRMICFLMKCSCIMYPQEQRNGIKDNIASYRINYAVSPFFYRNKIRQNLFRN